jgi:hypothetical protein
MCMQSSGADLQIRLQFWPNHQWVCRWQFILLSRDGEENEGETILMYILLVKVTSLKVHVTAKRRSGRFVVV